MRSYLPLVRSIARRYARHRDDLDDLVQAGSVGLVKAASRFDPGRGVGFATFVTPSVEGEIRRHVRAGKGGVPVARDAATFGADEAAAEQTTGGEALDASDVRMLIAGGLRALNRRERRIVFLRFHADLTERQIAQKVGISQAHVSRLLEGALVKLRAELTSSEAQRPGSTENAVISPNSASNIEPVEVGEKGQDATAPAGEAGDTATPSRRPSKSRTTTGYSGRILVRMPSELHEQLAQAAEREDISLNRYVNDALSSSVDGAGDEAKDVPSPNGRAGPAPALRVALATNLAIVIVAAVVAVVLLILALQRGI